MLYQSTAEHFQHQNQLWVVSSAEDSLWALPDYLGTRVQGKSQINPPTQKVPGSLALPLNNHGKSLKQVSELNKICIAAVKRLSTMLNV